MYRNAYKLFIKGEIPDRKDAEQILEELPIDIETNEVSDIDTTMLEEAEKEILNSESN